MRFFYSTLSLIAISLCAAQLEAQQSAASIEAQMRQQVAAEYNKRQPAASNNTINFLGSLDIRGHQQPVMHMPHKAQALPKPIEQKQQAMALQNNLLMPSTSAQANNPVDLLQPSTSAATQLPLIAAPVETTPQHIATSTPASNLPPALQNLLGNTSNVNSVDSFNRGFLPSTKPAANTQNNSQENTIAAEHYLYAAMQHNPVVKANPAIPAVKKQIDVQKITVSRPIVTKDPVRDIAVQKNQIVKAEKKSFSKAIPVAILENITIGDAELAVIEQVVALQKNYGGKLLLQGDARNVVPLQMAAAAFGREGGQHIDIAHQNNVQNGRQNGISVLLTF